MPQANRPTNEKRSSPDRNPQQMREIEANQEALRRSIDESRRLIEQAAAMTRRYKAK